MRKLSLILLFVLLLALSIGTTVVSGKTITMVSQNYVEPQILCEMVKALIEEGTDLTINHKRNFQGSTIVHQAVIHGDASIYVSYTGTQFAGVLGQAYGPEWNREKVLKYVQEQYNQKFNLKWYNPFGFNNTYALAVRRSDAKKYNLKTASDLIPISNQMIIATDQTFKAREGDGYYELIDTYGFDFKRAVSMDYGLLYRALASDDVDVAVAYSTDGRIPALDLVVLEDDKEFFPPYDASLIIRNDLLEKYPVIDELVAPLIGSITVEEIQQVNSWVDVEGMSIEAAARKYLTQQGLI